ncbi:dTMP kinase [Enteropsectra breve]|nr:dTMP kinase [Enteropsectra breve]
MSERKLFIVLEGLDCCGKTSICKILSERLGNSVAIGFPERCTVIGQIINDYLSKGLKIGKEEVHLLYSANRYEKAEYIKETLQKSHIICDRYWLSGTAYSVAKGLSYDWCAAVDSQLPKPDFTFFIDADETVVAGHKGFGEEVHDKAEFQKKVYEVYKGAVEKEKLHVIDGRMTIEEMADEILNVLN